MPILKRETAQRLKDQGEKVGPLHALPLKAIQFGSGNFLRGFLDRMVNGLNCKGEFSGSIAVIQSFNPRVADRLKKQDFLYTTYLRGLDQGELKTEKETITAITQVINPYSEWVSYLNLAKEKHLRFVISNTTEAGILYEACDFPELESPQSFPAKLARLLYERFKLVEGNLKQGFIHLPCELIDYNGNKLKEIVLKHAADWNKEPEFTSWIKDGCVFLNTLVDQIISGFPEGESAKLVEEWGYADELLVAGERFHLLAIEGDEKDVEQVKKELPLHDHYACRWVEDLKPIKEQKVKVLNGLHTLMVLYALPRGISTVREAMENAEVNDFLSKALTEEILITITGEGKEEYAQAVLERFQNPSIQHFLSAIALNSASKVRERLLRTLLDYVAIKQTAPKYLSYAIAGLINLYGPAQKNGEKWIRSFGDKKVELKDDPAVLSFLTQAWSEDKGKMVSQVLQWEHWGQDLSEIAGLKQAVMLHLD